MTDYYNGWFQLVFWSEFCSHSWRNRCSSAFLTNFRFVSHPYACSKSLDVLYQRLWRVHWNRCEKCCLPWANRWDCHREGYRHVQVFGVLFPFSFLITWCCDTYLPIPNLFSLKGILLTYTYLDLFDFFPACANIIWFHSWERYVTYNFLIK